MRGTLTIAHLTWIEARRRQIVLVAVLGGLLFLLVFGTAVYFIDRAIAVGSSTGTTTLMVKLDMGLWTREFEVRSIELSIDGSVRGSHLSNKC